MTTSYVPKPGTVPARLLEHLQAHGGTMTRAAIANGFAIMSKNVDGNLATILKHRLLVRHQGAYIKTCYGLPGSDPAVATPVPPAAHLTLSTPAVNGFNVPDRAPRRPRATAEPAIELDLNPPAADAPPPPIAALWSDGDIVVYGAQVNADDTVTLDDSRARRLHKFLERVFGPNE